jgi:hydroxymethylpyrimidine kinase/phosphomethylpyrimidine kinase
LIFAFCLLPFDFMHTVFSIAGFDPSGGAGTLADIKTFAAFGCFGAAAITSLTSQNTTAVFGADHQSAETVRAQIQPILSDFEIAAVKTGMLPTREIIELTAQIISENKLRNIVVDPVIRSTSGYDLLDDATVKSLIELLLPSADIITPNMTEAERLTQLRVSNLAEMKRAAQQLHARIAPEAARYSSQAEPAPRRAVLVKGGHLDDECTDVLYDGRDFHLFHSEKVNSRNTHGTGCTLSAAIAALLANGCHLIEAVRQAKEYVTAAIRTAPNLGHGAGPLNHFPRQ